jgi:hypothetical protein
MNTMLKPLWTNELMLCGHLYISYQISIYSIVALVANVRRALYHCRAAINSALTRSVHTHFLLPLFADHVRLVLDLCHIVSACTLEFFVCSCSWVVAVPISSRMPLKFKIKHFAQTCDLVEIWNIWMYLVLDSRGIPGRRILYSSLVHTHMELYLYIYLHTAIPLFISHTSIPLNRFDTIL